MRVAALATLLSVSAVAQNVSDSLPVLDFGYALHRAAEFNVLLLYPFLL